MTLMIRPAVDQDVPTVVMLSEHVAQDQGQPAAPVTPPADAGPRLAGPSQGLQVPAMVGGAP